MDDDSFIGKQIIIHEHEYIHDVKLKKHLNIQMVRVLVDFNFNLNPDFKLMHKPLFIFSISVSINQPNHNE